MDQEKHVGILLRVSTKGQATQADGEADIPTQRTACMRFIADRPGWTLVKEYREIGISGYKNSFADRDKLLEAREDIAAGLIDVLVVFMFDRLGRIEEETPFVVKSFVELGAEVWSVTEGQRKFDAHVDNLLNYLYFWQASGESKKTSLRVSNAMTQMARNGQYTGGRPPYGYQLVETGRLTKKRLPERTLAVREDEAAIVRLVFALAATRGFGCHRIALYLNERGIATRSGTQWGHATVANLLNNPLYKGIKAYGRTTGKGLGARQKRLPPDQWTLAEPNADWMIVPPEQWDTVRRRRTKAASAHSGSTGEPPVKSRLLFAGLTHCGECGAKMHTGYTTSRWTTTDGLHHRKSIAVYQCGAKATGKTGCRGPRHHRNEMVEQPLIDCFVRFISSLPPALVHRETAQLLEQAHRQQRTELNRLQRELTALQREQAALEAEIVRAIAGDSTYDSGLLQRLLKNKVDAAAKKQRELQRQDRCEEHSFPAEAPDWNALFSQASYDEKKAALCTFVRQVRLYRDQIEADLAIPFTVFAGSDNAGV